MILLILILLGVCFGSFINALVWRMYKQQGIRTRKQRAEYSIAHGRSMCPHCRHVLAPQDLVPIVSWVLLRGRCRYCRKSIPDTPLPELLLPILFVVSLWVLWPSIGDTENILKFCFWLTYLVLFVALGLYDFRWQLLPNRLVAVLGGLIGLQLLTQAIFFGLSLNELVMHILAAATGGGIFWLLFQLSDGKWIGGGDVKLGFALGAILGTPILALLYIFIASCLGVVAALPGLLTRRTAIAAKLPFGPFLLSGAFITYLFGSDLVGWYLGLVGL